MIIDKLLKISNDQAVTVTAPSTDVIDFGQVNPNTGLSDRAAMVVTVGVTPTAARMYSSMLSSSCTTSMPRPPSTKDGRTMTG